MTERYCCKMISLADFFSFSNHRIENHRKEILFMMFNFVVYTTLTVHIIDVNSYKVSKYEGSSKIKRTILKEMKKILRIMEY